MEAILKMVATFAGTQLVSIGADAVTNSVLDSMGIHTSNGQMYKEVTDVVTDFGTFAAHDLACTIEDVGDGTKRIVSGIKDGAGLYKAAVKATFKKTEAAIGALASEGVYIGKELYDNVTGFFDDLFPGKETVDGYVGNDGTTGISAADAVNIYKWFKAKHLYMPGSTGTQYPTYTGNTYDVKALPAGEHELYYIWADSPVGGPYTTYNAIYIKFHNNVSGKFSVICELEHYQGRYNINIYPTVLCEYMKNNPEQVVSFHKYSGNISYKGYEELVSFFAGVSNTTGDFFTDHTTDLYNSIFSVKGLMQRTVYITATTVPSATEIAAAILNSKTHVYLDGVDLIGTMPTMVRTDEGLPYSNIDTTNHSTANSLEHATTESETTGAHNAKIIDDIDDSKFTAVIGNPSKENIGNLLDAFDAAGAKALSNGDATTKDDVKHPAITDTDGNVVAGNPQLPIALPLDTDIDYPISITPDGKVSTKKPIPDTIPWDKLSKAIPTVMDPTVPKPTNTGTTPAVVAPTVSGSALSMFVVHAPTDAEVASLSTYLWTPDFFTNISKIMQDPMSCIISLHQIYCTPIVNGTSNIKLGYLDSGVTAALVSNQYVDIDCGYVTVPKYYGNAMDNDPYTSVQIYLPFIGFAQLSNAEVMGAKVYCKYVVDVFTGSCIASLKVVRDNLSATLYQYGGTCGVQLPITGSNFSGVISALAGITAGAIGTLTTGGIGGLAIGGMVSGAANAASKATSTSVSINRGGGFGSNIGAMGIKVPYIIITRKIAHCSTVQPYGLMDNTYRKLSDCSGYVQVKEVNVTGIKATKSELIEIESQLKEGVII